MGHAKPISPAFRSGRRPCGVALALFLATVPGCKRAEDRYLVDRVEVKVVEGDPLLGLSAAQVRQLLLDRLAAHGKFDLSLERRRKAASTPLRLSLEVAPAREEERGQGQGAHAVVAAQLSVSSGGPTSARWDVEATGEAKLAGDGLDERQEAARQALAQVLGELVSSSHLLLVAAAKPEGELLKDLAGKGGEKEAAIRVLTDRRNPKVAEALIEKLGSSDLDEVRRAMGALIELKEQRAVPAMIDLGRARNLIFQREVLFAVSELGGAEAEAYLYTVAQGHDHPDIRAAAEQALAELTARKNRSKGARTEAPKGQKTP
ncbi:MAG: HEAT repeat domain-containing protein [Myxococcales bacterium]|nr:HEAT repeat domain-containing protein [Myxococcales bacterium]